ncbi:hypothetical protein C1645_872175, partial [Glomus cerebriforme]
MTNNRSINDTKSPPNAHLFRQNNGRYYFGLEGHPNLVPFTVPTIKEVLETCKESSKKPPTIYIIFRNPIQNCLRELNFKFERKVVSKISSNLWRRIDPELRTTFENLYQDTSEQWRRGRIIFEFFTPLIELPTNEPSHPVSVPSSSSPSPIEIKPKLSHHEEEMVIGELFGWAYVPGYNRYLQNP